MRGLITLEKLDGDVCTFACGELVLRMSRNFLKGSLQPMQLAVK